MRHWMVHPRILCRKHLIAENVEAHMFISSIKKGISMTGYLKNNLLEPLSLVTRHDTIAREMIRRGYNHNSPVIDFEITDFITNPVILNHKVDQLSAFRDLITRCQDCKSRFIWYVKNNHFEITDDIIDLFKSQEWLIENLDRFDVYEVEGFQGTNFKRLVINDETSNNYDKCFINKEYYFDCDEFSGGILNPLKEEWELLSTENLEFLKLKLL